MNYSSYCKSLFDFFSTSSNRFVSSPKIQNRVNLQMAANFYLSHKNDYYKKIIFDKKKIFMERYFFFQIQNRQK
jgi:hypothetical protein